MFLGAMFLGALLGGVGSPKVGHESALGCSTHFDHGECRGHRGKSECCGCSKTYGGFSKHGVLLGQSDASHLIVTHLHRTTSIYVRILPTGGGSNDVPQG